MAALLLAGCAAAPDGRVPVFAAPPLKPAATPGAAAGRLAEPLQAAPANPRNLPLCPRELGIQAQWLARNLARVRLGMTKLEVVGTLGDPGRAETFALTTGAAVEVLFYHTPQTICRVPATDDSLLPLVFQDDRLMGYGPSYYKTFIAPLLKQAMLETQDVARKTAPSTPDPAAVEPAAGTPWQQSTLPPVVPTPGPVQQQNLPTPPAANAYVPAGNNAADGYSGGMNLGRGTPLQ
jgi:hypothetical protein